MPTRGCRGQQEQKLAFLRSLASEAFRELDQGRGAAIDGPQDLADLIAQIGRRAAERVETRSAGE